MEQKPLQTKPVGKTELSIIVAWSAGARQFMELPLKLNAGATVADALAFLDPTQRESAGLNNGYSVGIWGKKAPTSRLLQDRDRIEFYRPLLVDPKTARRERFNRQGAAKAGLFANKRAGAKAGY